MVLWYPFTCRKRRFFPIFFVEFNNYSIEKILESCGLITIKDDNIKFVIDTSGHGGNYSWSVFLLENSLSSNYFTKMSVSRYSIYQRNMYFNGLSNARDTNINPSSRFHFKKSRKFCELKILLNEKVYKMKSVVRINTLLINSNVEEKEFSNDIPFSKNMLLVPTFETYLASNFIKNIISNNNIEEESTLE